MPNINDDLLLKAGFFHSLGAVITEKDKTPGEERYKSAHNVASKEVWLEQVPYSLTFEDAQNNASGSSIVSQIGSASSPVFLYPLGGTNYQTWFMDTGTPSTIDSISGLTYSNGFEPSEQWCKPLIGRVDATNDSGFPSYGYDFRLYEPNGTYLNYPNATYEVDYFAGLIRFDSGKRPIDGVALSNLPTFDKAGLESLLQNSDQASAVNFIKDPNNNAPRAVAFQYIGQTLADGGAGGGGSITLHDYNTGLTVSNVSNIVIRGGVVNIPGATAIGGLMTGSSPTAVIWIPAPDYADYFSPSLFSSTSTRYVSNPDTNDYLISGVPGEFGIGQDWTAGNTGRPVFNVSGSITAFSDSDFACFTTGTTMSFYLYDEVDNVISSIDNFVINGVGSTSSNGITINITNFEPDADRYKATVNGSIDVPTLFPNGGRMSWEVKHYNGEGDGNGVSGVYSYSKNDIFYDAPGGQSNTSSTAKINGTVTFDEKNTQIVYRSGVAYYGDGTIFSATVSDIDLLNEISYPTDKQIDIVDTSMLISSDHQGHSDGSTGKLPITNWSTSWDISNLVYSVDMTVNQTGYVPDFSSTTTNVINTTTPLSKITSKIYDWGIADTKDSSSKFMLFDTVDDNNGDHNENPIIGEGNRYKFSNMVSGTNVAFDSTAVLGSLELQYIFGRVIYPQHNFQSFYPSDNFGASVDYSGLGGGNIQFNNVYTDVSTLATSSVTFNGYRWYAANIFSKSNQEQITGNVAVDFLPVGNASNFLEEHLHYDAITKSAGSEDLVIMIGLISQTGNTPFGYIFLSGNTTSWAGRVSATATTSTLRSSSKIMEFNGGNISYYKFIVFVGYKDSTVGRQLYLKAFDTNLA